MNAPWILRQTWNDLLFAHWPVAPAILAPLIPPGLALDTFDGQAWVGVVPFTMSFVRPRLLPPLPGVSFFPEINVRTYVTADGKPGVWFFSLDAGNALAVALARRFFHLNYYTARFTVQHADATTDYASRRMHHGAQPGEFAATYRPSGPVFQASSGSLEYFLTERYCLYAANRQSRLFRGDIRHQPWPLQPAAATIARNTLAQAAGIALPDQPPLLHFAKRLRVVCWPLTPA